MDMMIICVTPHPNPERMPYHRRWCKPAVWWGRHCRKGYEEGLEEGRKIGIRLVRGCMKDCFRDGTGQDHQLKKKKKSKCVVQRLKKKGLPKDAIDDILYLIDHKGERF